MASREFENLGFVSTTFRTDQYIDAWLLISMCVRIFNFTEKKVFNCKRPFQWLWRQSSLEITLVENLNPIPRGVRGRDNFFWTASDIDHCDLTHEEWIRCMIRRQITSMLLSCRHACADSRPYTCTHTHTRVCMPVRCVSVMVRDRASWFSSGWTKRRTEPDDCF